MNNPPRAEYCLRLDNRRKTETRLDRRHRTIGNCRLVLAIVVVWLAVRAFKYNTVSPWWLLLPIAAFLGLVIVHEPVVRALRRSRRAITFYETAIARLDHCWMGKGESGERFMDSTHPYSADLDLFGEGSLFELLCTARTLMGVETLAQWLCRPAAVTVARERQVAIDELRYNLDLREDLAVLGEEVRAGTRPEALADWGERKPLLKSGHIRTVLFVFAVLGLISLPASFILGRVSLVLSMAVVNSLIGLRFRKRVRAVIRASEAGAHDLSLLAGVLARLENERFKAPRLVGLQAAIQTHGWPPSRRIQRLNRLMELLDSRRHVVIAVINPLVLWTVQLAFAVESWRKESGPDIRSWLAAVGELEALLSLAGYAYEHPQDVFPEFAETGPCFEADSLAHPLIPEDRAVPNDLILDQELRVAIVSGSNMSGKSTLLRAVGVNAVLAQTGAPVRAVRMRMSALALGASIRIQDSLQSGISRFYAEILRLHQILELAQGCVPVLFLLDELLQGTNSHDRRIGAAAIIRGLVQRKAIGLATTHDLALTQIADELGSGAANVHFEDQLAEGKLSFDYKLRPGVVQRSNAIALMRSVGLEV